MEPLTVSGNPNVSDPRTGRTPLHIAALANAPRLIAALVEAGADVDAYDLDGTTALNAATVGGNRLATGTLTALGASRTSDPSNVPPELNARIVAAELFQGPMVWQWQAEGSRAADGGSGNVEESGADHAKTLLHRPATLSVRIGSEAPEPMPELTLSLGDAAGRAWAVQPEPVLQPRIVSVPGSSASGLWERNTCTSCRPHG